jgi:hypothetical protein
MEQTKAADVKQGLRYDTGKLRYDLFEPFAMQQLAMLFTKGAAKYADRNWEKGMKWSRMMAAVKRHIAEYESGKDFDFDPNCETCKAGTCVNHTGVLHTVQAAWGMLGLTSYYKLFPQGDDRAHKYLSRPKIGLDIDGVICDWCGSWSKKFGYPEMRNWRFSYNVRENFASMTPEEMHEFYMSIPALLDPQTIPFEPHCYITARSIPEDITKAWIQKNGFPTSTVYSVGFGESKVEAAKKSGIDIFVDDCFENFAELNANGICTYLYDAPHNQRYNVGHKRIKSLNELVQ